jgi:hypothetical protein
LPDTYGIRSYCRAFMVRLRQRRQIYEGIRVAIASISAI